MPLSFEREYFEDREDFFAFFPVKTIRGWRWAVDCVRVFTLDPVSGWKTHVEPLNGR